MSLASAPRKFLVIDDNADSRTLLTRTLLRKFPESVTLECENGDTAAMLVRSERVDAAIAHRTYDHDGATLVRLLRQVAPDLPIVMVSGYDRRDLARECGADAFMNYDSWLTIGNVIADVFAARAQKKRPSAILPPVREISAEPDPV